MFSNTIAHKIWIQIDNYFGIKYWKKEQSSVYASINRIEWKPCTGRFLQVNNFVMINITMILCHCRIFLL